MDGLHRTGGGLILQGEAIYETDFCTVGPRLIVGQHELLEALRERWGIVERKRLGRLRITVEEIGD